VSWSKKYLGICPDELRNITKTWVMIAGVPGKIVTEHVSNTRGRYRYAKPLCFPLGFRCRFVLLLISGGMLIGWGESAADLNPPHDPCCSLCPVSECKKYGSVYDVPSIFMTFNKFTSRHCSVVELLPPSRHWPNFLKQHVQFPAWPVDCIIGLQSLFGSMFYYWRRWQAARLLTQIFTDIPQNYWTTPVRDCPVIEVSSV
jgi:hypothetical protein